MYIAKDCVSRLVKSQCNGRVCVKAGRVGKWPCPNLDLGAFFWAHVGGKKIVVGQKRDVQVVRARKPNDLWGVKRGDFTAFLNDPLPKMFQKPTSP